MTVRLGSFLSKHARTKGTNQNNFLEHDFQSIVLEQIFNIIGWQPRLTTREREATYA
jgi:hypothetical protein